MRVQQWEKIQNEDPYFSLNLMKTRIWNLVQTIGYSYREDPTKYQDLVTPHMQKILNNIQSDTILLDMYISKCEPIRCWHAGNDQLVSFECMTEQILLQENRIFQKNKKMNVTLSRPRNSKTPVMLQESFISCQNCGANLDVTESRCPYCGNHANISGWKVDNITGLLK